MMASPTGSMAAVAIGAFFTVYGVLHTVTINPPPAEIIIPDRFTGTDWQIGRAELIAEIAENSRLIAENSRSIAANTRGIRANNDLIEANHALIREFIQRFEQQNERLRENGVDR